MSGPGTAATKSLALALRHDGDGYLVAGPELQPLVIAMLERTGVPPGDAEIVANGLIGADARGMNSHGILRLLVYIRRLQEGGFSPVTTFQVVRESPGSALIDAGSGLGAVATTRAMDLAIEKARVTGVAAVGVTGSNHNGEGAPYVMQAVRADMVGIATTNGSPIMPVWGGKTPVSGPLPMTFGVPTGDELPIVLDAALGMSSRGKILYYAETSRRDAALVIRRRYASERVDELAEVLEVRRVDAGRPGGSPRKARRLDRDRPVRPGKTTRTSFLSVKPRGDENEFGLFA